MIRRSSTPDVLQTSLSIYINSKVPFHENLPPPLPPLPGRPLAGKFPCKRKFWPVQGKGQGNQIYQEMARKFEPGQGNC